MKNLVIRETYKDKNGEEKVSWNRIGILFESKEGKEYAKLYHIPNVLINVFEQKPKKDAPAADTEWLGEQSA